jgi:hypothetical protein
MKVIATTNFVAINLFSCSEKTKRETKESQKEVKMG